MSTRPTAWHVRVAVLLAVMLVALVAGPVEAGPRRYQRLERFTLKLVNCTRTGGWVKADGTCKGYGSGRYSRYRPPLQFHRGIADEIAWPWARKIARAGYCGHTLAGSSVERRFRAAGYRNRHQGENVGCSYAWGPRRTIIRTHRWMQAEKRYQGWHWRQIKDPDFRSAGIGVARARGRSRVVVDFYGATGD